MERLSAFEFIPVTNSPQMVCLKRDGAELLRCQVVGWLALSFGERGDLFESKDALTIEGQGLGRPSWNDEQPQWVQGFAMEADERIALLKTAMARQLEVGR